MNNLKITGSKVVGVKQTVRVIKNNLASEVYLAENCDDFIKNTILTASKEADIKVIYVKTMRELGEACGIDREASAAALLKD